MKLLEIFNRENRKWVASISINESKFCVQAFDKEVELKIDEIVKKIIFISPRHMGAVKEGEKITEIMTYKEVEVKEENFLILEKELDGWFPYYRFVLVESDDFEKEKERALKIIKDAKYLTFMQKEVINKMFMEVDKKEIILLISDTDALECLSGLI